jgi:hypothetical protein
VVSVRATIGNRRLAEKWFHSSGKAVRWLRHQAPVHYPQIEFTGARDRVDAHIDTILDDLYASDISGSISWIWDGGFYVTLGAPKQAEDWAFPSSGEAVAWLIDQLACITPTAISRASMAVSCDAEAIIRGMHGIGERPLADDIGACHRPRASR